MRQSGVALAALGLIALIWGYNWVVMKNAVAEVEPFAFLAWRLMLAAGLLFVVLYARGGPMRVTHVSGVLAIGLIHSGATFALMTWALIAGAAGKSAVISYSMPFFVVILAWPVLGERPSTAQWLAIVIAAVGLILLVQPSALIRLPELLALASGLTWAVGVVITKRLQLRYHVDTLVLSAWQLFFGGIAMVVLALAFSSRPWVWSPYVVFAVLFNAVVVSALSWVLFFWVLSKLESGIASLGTLATPIVGICAGMIELGERPTPLEWVGIGLVIAALGIVAALALEESQPR